ncbi:DMT family transporter [Oceanidesulfovibrio marinus]|uniref:DMT family transporter n=1 Tax=Oceanidesulfovibrio marinus TaxID=370038 RepID=UPI0022A8CCEE|nr:EamA family transporter [Oceanidesulfovibrio marinus]
MQTEASNNSSGGILLVMLAGVLWGLIGPVAKLAIASGMDVLEVGFYRTMIGWLLFGGHAVYLGRTRVELRDLPLIMAFGVLGVGGLFGGYVVAVDQGGAALAAVLLYTAPAWVALLSWLLLGETMSVCKLAAVGMTILGVALISQLFSSNISVTAAAIGFGLLAGFSYALYYIFGKLFLGRYHTSTLFLYALPCGAAVMLPFFSFHAPTMQGMTSVATLGFVSTYVAYFVYYMGLQRVEATRAAVAATVEPLTACLLAYAMFGEVFTTSGYAGAGLILGGVLLSIWDGSRMRVVGREAVKAFDGAVD